MLKKLFDTNETASDIMFRRPAPETLNAVLRHNSNAEKASKNLKKTALIFVLLMAVLWIGGDIAGLNSDLVLVFGLLTILGYPLIMLAGAIWLGRRSVRKKAEALSAAALGEMDIPEDAAEIELLFPKGCPDDFFRRKDLCFENNIQLAYADHEALYIADVTGTVKLPYALTEPWSEPENRALVRQWVQSSRPSAYYQAGVRKKSRLVSLIPFARMFFPDQYLIPYYYTVVHTADSDYLLCIPSYEAEKLPKP